MVVPLSADLSPEIAEHLINPRLETRGVQLLYAFLTPSDQLQLVVQERQDVSRLPLNRSVIGLGVVLELGRTKIVPIAFVVEY